MIKRLLTNSWCSDESEMTTSNDDGDFFSTDGDENNIHCSSSLDNCGKAEYWKKVGKQFIKLSRWESL